MSEISSSVYRDGDSEVLNVRSTGGTRRERGSKIGALIRSESGGWERFHLSYSETDGFLSATYAIYRRKVAKQPSFEAHIGRPSWHQAKAGAISAGIVRFDTKAEAEEYVARYKAGRPGEPAFVIAKD